MKCIYCGCMDSKVIDSRVNEDGTSIRRRRSIRLSIRFLRLSCRILRSGSRFSCLCLFFFRCKSLFYHSLLFL